LPDAAADGAAGNHHLGVPRRGRLLARRVRPLPRLRPEGAPARGQPGGRRGRAAGRRRGLRPLRGTPAAEGGMIITRSPLRISLGGGGTDLPSYYRKHTGFLIAAAIDKYVCITLHQTYVPELIVKYSRMERVRSLDEVQHPIIRESLRLAGLDGGYLEIT